MSELDPQMSGLPADDPGRTMAHVASDSPELPHLGVVGDTYTILLTGAQTNGQYCLIDMHVPPGGGPPPHRHDFEETFMVLAGEVVATFRGDEATVRAGETIHIPANAPHQFVNRSAVPARLLCICAPAGQEELFRLVGVPVAGRTTAPPPPAPDQEAQFRKKAEELAPRFRTELLEHA